MQTAYELVGAVKVSVAPVVTPVGTMGTFPGEVGVNAAVAESTVCAHVPQA